MKEPESKENILADQKAVRIKRGERKEGIICDIRIANNPPPQNDVIIMVLNHQILENKKPLDYLKIGNFLFFKPIYFQYLILLLINKIIPTIIRIIDIKSINGICEKSKILSSFISEYLHNKIKNPIIESINQFALKINKIIPAINLMVIFFSMLSKKEFFLSINNCGGFY